MANDEGPQDQSLPHQLFVRADEIDSGTSIISPTRELPLSALNPLDGASQSTARPSAPARPGLRNDIVVPPPPPSQPPPAPPNQTLDPTDSLSLPQLRQLVSQFPKSEQRAYAFQYKDADDFEAEVDEWFHYTPTEQDRGYLLASRDAFEQKWKSFAQSKSLSDAVTWTSASQPQRQEFVSDLQPLLESGDYDARVEALECAFYILAGTWSITSGLETMNSVEDGESTSRGLEANAAQIQWMHNGASVIAESPIVPLLYACLIHAAKPPDASPDVEVEDVDGVFGENEYRELSLCLSCLYILVESARNRVNTPEGQKLRLTVSSLQPSLLVFLANIISRLRWDESYNIPLMHPLQLFWKSILLIFGDINEHLEKVKSVVQPRVDPFSAEASHPVLTASPLDYHLFRQEITSKYPAYNPPLPLVPLEIEQKTMLPPLPITSRYEPSPSSGPGTNGSANRGSILHQPVHIATPAPSPPPSPAGPGGKGGKKQNYQTNQNFPFLYPPLDATSNNIGGRGSTSLQDIMVGKEWEGSDIPASIIEAGELFASRMRMPRAMRQLWKERDLFMKYERGWRGELKDLEQEINEQKKPAKEEADLGGLDEDSQSRMQAVEAFFQSALPDLQSLVIVMMKVMLTNVQDIAVRAGNLTEPATSAGGLNRTKSNPNINANATLPMPPPPPRPTEMTLEELNNVRSREISQKAVSGAIFLLLKWFKTSHVLKFEYLTQLLLDSNYVQLTLKYFAHQNLEDLVAFKYDRDDFSFWHYCHLHSDQPPLSPTSPASHSSSEIEDAVPPAITRHRRSPTTTQPNTDLDPVNTDVPSHPTVDELGNPLAPLPTQPIEDFSFRHLHTSTTLLRILQKVTRSKPHRILFLVQFKSSQILRRILRVPDTTLRLYVLKLFKSQVPYCGRKWRQSNMRVITAVYLHCRPELRDEWLAGMHDANVEGEVEEAVPAEWALRGLTFWWLKRMYPSVMKGMRKAEIARKDGQTQGSEAKPDEDEDSESEDGDFGQQIDSSERDFFQRELDALGWGLAALRLGEGEDVAFGEEAAMSAHVNGTTAGTNSSYTNGANEAGAYAGTQYAPGGYVVNTGPSHPRPHVRIGGAGESGQNASPLPQTPLPQPQPQWVVADAATLEDWQNS